MFSNIPHAARTNFEYSPAAPKSNPIGDVLQSAILWQIWWVCYRLVYSYKPFNYIQICHLDQTQSMQRWPSAATSLVGSKSAESEDNKNLLMSLPTFDVETRFFTPGAFFPSLEV